MTRDPIEIRTGDIRAFECYREGWAMLRPQYGIILAVVLIGMLFGGAVSIILGSMMCGIYICLFDLQEGRQVKIERLFQGFSYFLPGLLITILIMVPVIVMIAVVYIPLLAATFAGGRMSSEELTAFLIGTFVIEAIFVVVMVCFHTLLLFAYPLVVDKKLSAFQAVKWSAIGVWRNLSGVASLFGVGFLLSMAGMLLFCIGVYLTMPIMLAATTVAYRKVYPGRFEAELASPPPPQFYQGV
jgi:uncharacterized membrane protein